MFLSLLIAVTAVAPPDGNAADESSTPRAKLSSRLLRLIVSGAAPSRLLRFDHQNRVQVYIEASPVTQAIFDTIVKTGGTIDRQQNDVVQAWVPVEALEIIAALPEVRRIRPPEYASPQTDSVTTAGDTVLRASDARQLFGVTGQGVRVGVISDGLAGLATSSAQLSCAA